MLIEHTIKRAGGSDHEIGGVTYEFREDKDGKHVCEVKNAEHARRFLSISTFRKIGGKTAGADTGGNDAPADGGTGDAPADGGSDTGGNDVADLSELNKSELLAIAKDAGIDVDGRMKKDDLIAAIEANTEAAEG